MIVEKIESFYNLSKLQPSSERIQNLLKRLKKDCKELKDLGIDIDIENVECSTNDNFLKDAFN